MTAPRIEAALPIVPVRDVAATVAFYTDILGFEARLVTDDGAFAVVGLDGAGIQLLKTDDAQALLDAFYEELRPKLDTLPPGRVRPPFDQPYGMREFHVKDPDGCLLFFGEEA